MNKQYGLRKMLTPLHTWAGLVISWLLYFIFVTGTIGYFDSEIDTWARPDIPTQNINSSQAVEAAVARLSTVAKDADSWFIGIPGNRDNPHLSISWRYQDPPEGQSEDGTEYINTETQQPYAVRDTGGGQSLYRMHYNLHYMPVIVGRYLVGIATMFMLVAIISGVIIHKKIFKDFFTFRPKKGQRSWLDMHNLFSVATLPFHLMITYSGLLFYAVMYMPSIMLTTYGTGPEAQDKFIHEVFPHHDPEPHGQPGQLVSLTPMLQQAEQQWGKNEINFISIDYPSDSNALVTISRQMHDIDRQNDALSFNGTSGELLNLGVPEALPPVQLYLTMLGLHEGNFANLSLRWLYFISGLLGTAMIATGLILWSVKRKPKSGEEHTQSPGHKLVDVLNIATVVGLPIAIAGFFWANRLLPIDMPERAEWEIHILFITWLAMLVFALVRPRIKAWVESLWLAAIAFCLIPVISAFTTDKHLFHSLSQGDWVFAGVELTLLALGITFAIAAQILKPSPLKQQKIAESTAL